MTEIRSSTKLVRIRLKVRFINLNTDFIFVEIRRNQVKLFNFVIKVRQFSWCESVPSKGNCSVIVSPIVNSAMFVSSNCMILFLSDVTK